MRFSDGMTFDTSGPLRLTRRKDGWYVIGEGFLCAVDSPEEGERFIEVLKKRSQLNNRPTKSN
tara:strand:+ start:81 stop:269 length:189 start_codon:yes stop_codon:yes gene_type:complete